jgi:hypothetical protein
MPLDSTFDDDDSQPWWQISPPLRITVHPAAPASPQPDSRAPADGIDDWIEPDGYPDDWIASAGARAASGGSDRTAPAKAVANASLSNRWIESDGYPNDWIEPDGYPDDWIAPVGASTPSGGSDRTAPAKAVANASLSNRWIESDGYPNDWIEPDGYPDDWITPVSASTPLGGIDRIAPAKAAADASPDGYPDDWISPALQTPPVPSAQPTAANPGISNRSALPPRPVPSPASGEGLVDQTPDLETGLTPSQIRDALSFIGGYLRANDPQLARLPTDVADMFHDAVTDFPEFLRRAEPGLSGLGLSVPMTRAAGNVWLLNDLLRGRIAEIVHGRNLPFTFPKIDKFVSGIATSIKSINLNAPYYQDAKALYYTLRNQINRVAGFIGAQHADVIIEEHEIVGRALDVLVPHAGSVAQKSAIKQAIEYGAQQGVTVNIICHQ